jgi:flagellar hook-associated protein 3 FlgL
MRITNNMVTQSILAQIQDLNSQQSQLQTEVGSGLAMTVPSDNPSQFGQVVELQAQSSQLAQYNNNANQALQVASASYGGLQSLQSIYDRASQLGTLANGALGANAAAAYAPEVDQLIQQAVQVANTQLNGNYLFGGTAVTAPPFTATATSGTITGVAYCENNQQAAIQISTNGTITPGTSGATNAGIATLINSMIALRDALNGGDQTAIATATAGLAPSEDVITSAISDNGATQARIQATQTEMQSLSDSTSQLISNDVNADLPSTIVKLNEAQLAYQASLQTAASVMHLSILNYITLS